MRSGKITRVPIETIFEAKEISKAEKLKNNAEGFRRMVAYSRIGREYVKSDLLTANAQWFNIKLGKVKSLRLRKVKRFKK